MATNSDVMIKISHKKLWFVTKTMQTTYNDNHNQPLQDGFCHQGYINKNDSRDGLFIGGAMPTEPAPTCYTLWTSVIFPLSKQHNVCHDMAMPNTAGNRSDTMWWTLKTKYLLACDTESCRDDNSYSLPVISKLLICRCLVPSDLIGIIRNMVINYSVLSSRLHSGYSGCHNSSFTMTVNSLFLSYGIGERKWSALDASFE